LHITAALDASIFLPIAAAAGVNHVVAVSGFAVNGDAHVLEQAGVLSLKFCGFRSGNFENRLLQFDFLEIESRGLPGDVDGSGRRRILLFNVARPVAAHKRQDGHRRKHYCDNRRPARVLRRFTSQHTFS